MRFTEALHYYNSEKIPTELFINTHYSHFYPTIDDHRKRREYLQGLDKKPRKIIKEIFD